MGRFNWGDDGPPEDAYSRVTDPERFVRLHPFARKLADQLSDTYLVDRSEPEQPTFGSELRNDIAMAGVLLTPRDASCAPLEFAFTTFPGVIVRSGRARLEPFPHCGCDACDETFEDEAERLEWEVLQVVAGRFREGPAKAYDLWDAIGSFRSSRDLSGSREAPMEWSPWIAR